MDIADRYGELLRRELCSAERFNDSAMSLGSSSVNTSFFRSNALLCSVTSCDHFFFVGIDISHRRTDSGRAPEACSLGLRATFLQWQRSPFGRALFPCLRGSRSLGLLSLSIFINYIDRGSLSTASSIIKSELHLDTTQLGFLPTAFFITYAPMQLVIGALVDRYDAGKILVAGFAVWSLATVLTGFAHGFTALLLVRLLLGLGESVAFPSYAKISREQFSKASSSAAC